MIHHEDERRQPIKSWKEWGSILQYEHERLLESNNRLNDKYEKLIERVEKLENFRSAVIAIGAVIAAIVGIVEISINILNK